MQNTERIEPFLTLESRRHTGDGGHVTVVEVGCPELGYGIGQAVGHHSETRLIDEFINLIRTKVASLVAKNFDSLQEEPLVIETSRRIHQAQDAGLPIARLFRSHKSAE